MGRAGWVGVAVVEGVRLGGKGEVIVSARPVWRERSRCGVCGAVGAASRGIAPGRSARRVPRDAVFKDRGLRADADRLADGRVDHHPSVKGPYDCCFEGAPWWLQIVGGCGRVTDSYGDSVSSRRDLPELAD